MPRMRLVSVAEASVPEDFNICDIAPGGYGAKCKLQSSKFQSHEFHGLTQIGDDPGQIIRQKMGECLRPSGKNEFVKFVSAFRARDCGSEGF